MSTTYQSLPYFPNLGVRNHQDTENKCFSTLSLILYVEDQVFKTFIRLFVRKILAPGEEENLELEEEDAAAGAGATEAFPPRAPGTVSSPVTRALFEILICLCHFVIFCGYFTLCVSVIFFVHGFIAHSFLLVLQHRKVWFYT